MRLIGTAPGKSSILSFVMDGIHPHDIGTIVDREGVAVRTGHHCAQPVMDRFGIPATARASLAMYNTREDLDALGRALREGARGIQLMSDLSDLYQEVILDHNKRPQELPHASTAPATRPRASTRSAATACTSTCKVDDDVVTDVGFQGSGCAISKASASLMTDSVKGRPVAEVRDAVPALPHDGDDPAGAVGRGHGQAVGAGRRARVSGAREVRRAWRGTR